MRSRIRALALGGTLTLGMTLALGVMAPSANAGQAPSTTGAQGAADSAVKDGVGETPCTRAAAAKTRGGWVCIGNQLSYEVASANGQRRWVSEKVADEPITILATPPDDDFGCEPSGICNMLVDSYTAWVKGNAQYGVGGQIWGNFDVVWRQHFNGPWPTWRLHLIWDSGYTVDSDWWRAQVRKELALQPDPTLGYAYFYPANISAGSWHAWSPSSTGWTYASDKINESGKFHDDMYGFFYANGQRFGAATLHTGHWSSTWNSTTRTYALKYTAKYY